MQKLHFSIIINAPKEKVWNKMFDDNFNKYLEDAWPKALQKIKELSEK